MIRNLNILCADWAKQPADRSVWEIRAGSNIARTVNIDGDISISSVLAYAHTLEDKSILGIDAAIGAPSHVIEKFAIAENIENASFFDWISWLFSRGEPDNPVRSPEDWNYARPFIAIPPGKGAKQAFPDHGIPLGRTIDHGLNANSPLIVSGIPGTVGSGSRELWRELARLKNSEQQDGLGIWPFDGTLEELLAQPARKTRIVIAEIYPKVCYGIALAKHLPATLMTIAKTRTSARVEAVRQLIDGLENTVQIDNPTTCEQSEHEFDAMISAVALYKLLERGDISEEASRSSNVEGSILGAGAIALNKRATALKVPRDDDADAASTGRALRKKILYIDMDNVLVDFNSGVARLEPKLISQYGDDLDDVPGIFALMDPMPGAIAAFHTLVDLYDTYILSTAPWNNPSAWSDKVLWVRNHLGDAAEKRLILTHHKNLNRGDYLIDDRLKRGADKFAGQHIHFGQERFPDWDAVLQYLVMEG